MLQDQQNTTLEKTFKQAKISLKFPENFSQGVHYRLCLNNLIADAMATEYDNEVVLERNVTRSKPPRLYKVLLLNDDYTPMDFVVDVLQQFFSMDFDRAWRVMCQVHQEGRGVCGLYPKDIATEKVIQVVDFSRKHEHPLQCIMEES